MDSVVKIIAIANYIMVFQNPNISDLYYFIPYLYLTTLFTNNINHIYSK